MYENQKSDINVSVPLQPGMSNHIDLAMLVRQANGSVAGLPESAVSESPARFRGVATLTLTKKQYNKATPKAFLEAAASHSVEDMVRILGIKAHSVRVRIKRNIEKVAKGQGRSVEDVSSEWNQQREAKGLIDGRSYKAADGRLGRRAIAARKAAAARKATPATSETAAGNTSLSTTARPNIVLPDFASLIESIGIEYADSASQIADTTRSISRRNTDEGLTLPSIKDLELPEPTVRKNQGEPLELRSFATFTGHEDEIGVLERDGLMLFNIISSIVENDEGESENGADGSIVEGVSWRKEAKSTAPLAPFDGSRVEHLYDSVNYVPGFRIYH